MCTLGPRTRYAGGSICVTLGNGKDGARYSIGFVRLGLLVAIGWGMAASGMAATLSPGNVMPTEGYGPYQQITPTQAWVRLAGEETDAPAALYNGAGLDHKNPLLAKHGAAANTIWQARVGEDSYPVTLRFDLGGEFLVNEIWLWQPSRTRFAGQGVSEYDLVMYDANGESLGVVNRAAGPKTVGPQNLDRFNAFGECVFLPIPEEVGFVELRIYDNLGDENWLSLAEISFFGRERTPTIPEPSGGVLSCLGLGMLGAWQRRRLHLAC